jgi:glycosyltransferase involved in cell wall biosynthesis
VKIAILWTRLSGYLNGELQALAAKPGVELYVANEAAGADAPYGSSNFEWMPRRYEFAGAPDPARLLRELEDFRPDIILAAWHVKAFQSCCQHFASRAVRVGCGDNQWRGNLRQQVAAATAPFHLKKFYDAMFVPGERQAVWAGHMGFKADRIWRGSLTCDVASFAAAGKERDFDRPGSSPAFLFAGRLSQEKGIATLAEAYEAYAASFAAAPDQLLDKPWDCLVAGTGPLENLLTHPGFVKLGFVQPEALPQLFAQASCFVLPSLYEPWGVALHEAAAAGLPIVCTSECGASVHLVQDNYNGFIVDPGNASQLQAAMMRMSRLTLQRRQQMSEASRILALQFTPDRWATTILEKGKDLRDRLKIL